MKKLIVFIATFMSSVSFSQNKLQTIPQCRRDSLETAFLNVLNDYRKKHNLNVVSINKVATKGALYKAEYCATRGILTHDVLYDTFDNISRSHIWDDFYAENAASLINEYKKDVKVWSTKLLNMWISSPLHNQNLLAVDATRIGLSYAIDEKGNTKYFLVFTY